MIAEGWIILIVGGSGDWMKTAETDRVFIVYMLVNLKCIQGMLLTMHVWGAFALVIVTKHATKMFI